MALFSIVKSLLGVCHPMARWAQVFSDTAWSLRHLHQVPSPPGVQNRELMAQHGTQRASQPGEDLVAHLVFLPLELFLQVKFLSLQVADGLPQLLGFVPVGRDW